MGEPDTHHDHVFIGGLTGIFGAIVLFGPEQGPITLEAIVFMVALLGTAVSAIVSRYGVGQGYAVAAVPGLVAAALSLGLGIWMVTLAFVDLGVVFVVMGVAAAMTSVAAWMELLAYLEDEDMTGP